MFVFTRSPRATLRSMTVPSSGESTSSFARLRLTISSRSGAFSRREPIGLRPHVVDLLLANTPALQRPHRPRNGNPVGLDLSLLIAEDLACNRTFGYCPAESGQAPLHPCEAATGRRSDRSSSRPGRFSKSPPATAPCGPFDQTNPRRMVVARPEFDDLARKAGVHVRDLIGVEHQRARHLQRHRREEYSTVQVGMPSFAANSAGRRSHPFRGQVRDRVRHPVSGLAGGARYRISHGAKTAPR